MAGMTPKYKTASEIEEKIEDYFKNCEGEILKDADGNPVLNKYGIPVIVNGEPPTVTGLALALGFNTRKSLIDYQGKEAFVYAITRAKARIEKYTEQRLFDREGQRGAEFSLRCNFKWQDERKTVIATEVEDIAPLAALLKGAAENAG